jgi:hypothetical protein
MAPSEVRFIDITASEIALPDDWTQIAAPRLDGGIAPQALADHIRYAGAFPLSPELGLESGALVALSGGRALWAARKAGWSKPIRAVIRGTEQTLPPEVWRRTYPFDPNIGMAGIPTIESAAHTLSFSRALSPDERARTESTLRELPEMARKIGSPVFAEITDLAWRAPDVLTWRAPRSTNIEDRSMGAEWGTVQTRLCRELPLLALNGRRCCG